MNFYANIGMCHFNCYLSHKIVFYSMIVCSNIFKLQQIIFSEKRELSDEPFRDHAITCHSVPFYPDSATGGQHSPSGK